MVDLLAVLGLAAEVCIGGEEGGDFASGLRGEHLGQVLDELGAVGQWQLGMEDVVEQTVAAGIGWGDHRFVRGHGVRGSAADGGGLRHGGHRSCGDTRFGRSGGLPCPGRLGGLVGPEPQTGGGAEQSRPDEESTYGFASHGAISLPERSWPRPDG